MITEAGKPQDAEERVSDGWISLEIGHLDPEHDPWERNQFHALKELQRLRAQQPQKEKK